MLFQTTVTVIVFAIMIIIIKYQNFLRAYYVPDPGQELYKYNLIWNLQQLMMMVLKVFDTC